MRKMIPLALLTALTTAAIAAPLTEPEVPAALKHVADVQFSLGVHAKGVQIYECGPSKDKASVLTWNFKAPEATLADGDGKPVGLHYAGPTWEGLDGSKVVGQVKASAPSADPDSIPWLLLDAKSNFGTGTFARVGAIQRVVTHGGKAPAEGCDSARVGSELRVPYTADYFFYNKP
jgi:hypothetical protein